MSSENTYPALDHEKVYDVCVIGGGVNGAGIARDAAGRGLSVVMLEQDDLAQGTSSRSGKLIHGGLRYLEYYEFRLVREALIEREVLLKSAPHIIWPMRFVLPHSAQERPAWLVRLGLFLYDHLGGRRHLKATRSIDLRKDPEGRGIKPAFRRAFEYSDCWVDDSRLVVLNAVDAAERGAVVKTRTRCLGAERSESGWTVDILDTQTQESATIHARALVNAAGPWVERLIGTLADVTSARSIRLVKGSHIIVKKFWEGDQAYLIQNSDKRVIFINPYEHGRALIGTTDIPYSGDPGSVAIDESEVDYLLSAVNRYFIHQINKTDILDTFSGVRPLFDDNAENPSAVTRDYLFDIDGDENTPPVISVFGGKITTFRKLSEHALDRLVTYFPDMSVAWTKGSSLPGGDIPNADFDSLVDSLSEQFAFLPTKLVTHYARLYGTRTVLLLGNAESLQDLGKQFGEVFYEREVQYLMRYEWAQTVEDILDRRTKHRLHLSDFEVRSFTEWFDSATRNRQT